MTIRINGTAWVGSLLLMAILPTLASIPPWISEPLQLAMMHIFDPFCHQITERSPHVDGIQLAVCHRCYGILIGLVVGPIVALICRGWSGRNARIFVVASLVPLALDWGLELLGIWHNSAGSRFLTGSMFGIVAGVLVARAMAWRET